MGFKEYLLVFLDFCRKKGEFFVFGTSQNGLFFLKCLRRRISQSKLVLLKPHIWGLSVWVSKS